MATKEIKTYSLSEMKEKYIDKVGTQERDEYEYGLSLEVTARQKHNLTQLLRFLKH